VKDNSNSDEDFVWLTGTELASQAKDTGCKRAVTEIISEDEG